MATYSNTKIECFRNCPRQYYYRYVAKLKLPDTPRQIALFAGSRSHDALEWLYGQVMIGVIPTKEQTLDEFRSRWDNQWGDDIVIHDAGMTGSHYRSLGEKYVGDYYDAHHPFDDSTTIELEKQVRFDLDAEADISMIGFIDRLAKDDDGVWHIHDYKTNKRLPTQADMDQNAQLAYYEIGIRQLWPTIERVELHWHFLRFGETITSVRTPEQLQNLRNDALSTIRDMIARGKDEDVFETNETGLCNYCDFQPVCPVKKHEISVNGLPLNKYQNEPGVKLVNRWSELKNQKDELKGSVTEIDEEIAEVQEALLQYAKKEAATTVYGDEHEVTVRQSERVRFPTRSTEAEDYTKMTKILQESAYWDMVSGLDRNALTTLWKHPESLDAKLRTILERFAQVETDVKIGIRIRKGQ